MVLGVVFRIGLGFRVLGCFLIYNDSLNAIFGVGDEDVDRSAFEYAVVPVYR